LLREASDRLFRKPFCIEQDRRVDMESLDGESNVLSTVISVFSNSIELKCHVQKVRACIGNAASHLFYLVFTWGYVVPRHTLFRQRGFLLFGLECASMERVFGLDLFCLAVSACECLDRLGTPDEAVSTLIWGKGEAEMCLRSQLMKLWDMCGYSEDMRYITVDIHSLIH
jgi:hypothetical protein